MFRPVSPSKNLRGVTLIVMILLVVIGSAFSQRQQALFTQAINAAMEVIVQQASFQSKIYDILLFNVPKCSVSSSFPSTNPFQGMTKLKNCYQIESMDPWTSAYKLVAQELTNAINSHYSMSLENSVVLINTTEGFFSSLSSAVIDGRCDVVVADTSYSSERASLVSFQTCPYGSTSYGFIRNSKDNETLGYSTNVYTLNKNGTIVGGYYGTIFEDWIKNNLPLATYLPLGYDEQFDAVFGNKVHAIVGDVVDFSIYLNNHKASCPSCRVMTFGEPSSFSTFTKLATTSDSSPILKFSNIYLLVITIMLLALQL